MKTQSIKIAHGIPPMGGAATYRVIVVKNSTEYHPGQGLRKTEVDDLCSNKRWDVTIVGLKEAAGQC